VSHRQRRKHGNDVLLNFMKFLNVSKQVYRRLGTSAAAEFHKSVKNGKKINA